MISKECFTSQWIEEISVKLEYNDKNLIEKVIRALSMFNGREFSCFRGGGLNDMTILFGKYNCLTYFYELLKTHFDDYFKHYGCL